MELQITIDWSHVKNAVKKHLSIMGKRQKNPEGNTAFAGITLSSAEEDVMKQYINAAVETFVGEMAQLVTYYDSGDFLTFKISNSRWAGTETSVTVPFEGNLIGYVVAYVANAVLGMNYPDLAKKYESDMTNHLNAAIKLVFVKTEPANSGGVYNIDGTSTLENSEKVDGYGTDNN